MPRAASDVCLCRQGVILNMGVYVMIAYTVPDHPMQKYSVMSGSVFLT